MLPHNVLTERNSLEISASLMDFAPSDSNRLASSASGAFLAVLSNKTMEVSAHILWTKRFTYTFLVQDGDDTAPVQLIAKSHSSECQGYNQLMSRNDARNFYSQQLIPA